MQNPLINRREAAARLTLLTGLSLAGAATSRAAQGSEQDFIFCLNTATIRGQKLGIVKEIEVASQAGYQGFEPWVDGLESYVKGGGTLKDLAARIKDAGLRVESAIGFPEWIVDDDARRAKGLERAKREMEMVAQIGGRRMAAPPAGATGEPSLDLLKAAERYRALLELGESMGIQPMLELWGFSKNLNHLSQCLYVAAETGHPRACVLADIFHLYKGGSDLHGLKLCSATCLPVFHMNDFPKEPPREQANDGMRLFPGDGAAPMTQILRDLRAGGGVKVLSLELFNKKYYEQDALEVAKAGLAKMKAAVAASRA